ncbi:hypothetical protein AB0282_11245 [Pseudarthrobacter oxydans]|uniref:hypothetical protein n=1 Tax=Pseudarthrobacter oxydans TaxID=1671 RepID=UPI00344E4A9E
MEADEPPAMADRDDTAVRAARDVFPGFPPQHQGLGVHSDGADVDAFDTEQRL